MPKAHVYQYVVADIPGRPAVKVGSLSEARSVEFADGEISDQVFKVAASGIVKIWDKTENEAMGDFDLLVLESDLDVLVQFTTDAGGDDEYFVKELKGSGTAGKMGVALMLGSDLAHQFDGSVDLFDGTEDTVDEIWVKNEDSTNAASVRRLVLT